MHAVSQIIKRNLHRRESCGSGLWINPENDNCWQLAKVSCPSLKLSSQDHSAFLYLQSSGADIEFSAFPQASNDKYDWVILNLPRQKALLAMMLDCVAGLLAEDGVLWLAGENKAGIKSADKPLKLHFGMIKKLDNARHCTLYEASKPFAKKAFDPRVYREEWPLDCGRFKITVASYPGVFAHGRLDPGTALLLNALTDIPVDGDVLDFACGAGVVGACIASCNENANVTLLDNSALALKACEETLAANDLHGAILASDGLLELMGTFDLVVSNPPVHTGVKTDSRLSMRLMESIHDHINPGGALIMVANIHLPYEKWLSQRFRHIGQLVSNDRYKVILAKK